MNMASTRRRVLTGDRPTGKLHLGHYIGSLKARVELQNNPEYECFFIIADLHALTTRPKKADVLEIRENIREMVLDYLAVGIDPEKSTIFVQSAVPETYQLNLLFEMLVTLPRLTRLPTIKDMARAANIEEDKVPFGLVGYPVLQAADILLPRAHLVPVGRDNLPHVELTREIARRFNRYYGEVFPLPQALVPDVEVLPGIDGAGKMSKSRGNAILLSDDPETVRAKVMKIKTSPRRPEEPGDPTQSIPLLYHRLFNDDREEVEELWERYRKGGIKDKEIKERLAVALNRFLDPIRERRAYYAQRPEMVEEILVEGTRKMRQVARETMEMVWDAMGMYGAELARKLAERP